MTRSWSGRATHNPPRRAVSNARRSAWSSAIRSGSTHERSFYGLRRGRNEWHELLEQPERITATVDLGRRRLVVEDAGIVLIDHPVAVGRHDTPTPTGRFIVAETVDTNQAVQGTRSGYTIVLTAATLSAPTRTVTIEATTDTAAIGRAIAGGELLLPNDVLLTAAYYLSPGTPVAITEAQSERTNA